MSTGILTWDLRQANKFELILISTPFQSLIYIRGTKAFEANFSADGGKVPEGRVQEGGEQPDLRPS